jgi:hypothetical protein
MAGHDEWDDLVFKSLAPIGSPEPERKEKPCDPDL